MDKKLLMFMGGGLLVGGGVFAWYFLAGDAMVNRDAARKSITQWEGEWTKARRCLLGDAPAEADPADTLRIRAMNEDEPRCSLSELARPEGQGSGIPEIEDAWGKIETAWHALAKAVPDPDAMGPQIVALDRALAQLHDGAGLDAPAAPKATHAIATLTLTPPLAGTKGASFDDTPRDHVLFGLVAGDDAASLVIVRGPADAVIAPPKPSGTLAVAGAPTWAATASTDEAGLSTLAAGPLGADGHVTAPVTVTTSKQALAPVAAVGHGDARLILYSEDTPDAVMLRQVRSTDGGAHWGKPAPVAGSWGDRPIVEWLAGAIALSGSTEAGDDPTPMWMILDEAATPRVIAAAGQPDTRTCFARTLWHGLADDEGKLARVDGGEPTPPLDLGDRFDLRACTKDAAAVRVHEKLQRCAATACDAGLDVPNHVGVADVFDGSGVVFAAQQGPLVGVWRTGVAPVYAHAPKDAHLAAVVVWGGKPTLAFTTEGGLRTAPLP